METDDLEVVPPKKSFLEALMIVGTFSFAFTVVPLSVFCLAVANDIEVKPVEPDFDPMRFGTGFSILLMLLLFNAPLGFLCALIGGLVAGTRAWRLIFIGFAIYMFLASAVAGAVFFWA